MSGCPLAGRAPGTLILRIGLIGSGFMGETRTPVIAAASNAFDRP